MGIANDYPKGPVPNEGRPRSTGEYGRFTPHSRYYDGLSPIERDEKIVELRRRGWKLKQIAAVTNMSTSGVSDALKRIAEGRPGRDARG